MPHEALRRLLSKEGMKARAAPHMPFHSIRSADSEQPFNSRGFALRRRFGRKPNLFRTPMVLFCLWPLLTRLGSAGEPLPGQTAGSPLANAKLSSGLLLTNQAPRAFTPQSFQEALQRVLTAQEMSKVVDPL